MKCNVERLVLETIDNTGSIMILFKTGYAYSQVLLWCNELEKRGLVAWNDDVRVLTDEGYKRLLELKKDSDIRVLDIRPLLQYKIEKKKLEEIYLP